jgi:hypothetical protein
MQRVFDRPTPYTLRAIYVASATKAKLESTVGLNDRSANKQSRTPADVLGHQFVGGQRRFKGLEGALRRMGYLPNGWACVPGAGAPLDGYGNVPSSFVVTLMSVLQAFGEQGYRANATPATRARREKRGRTKSGYAVINGVAYFVSRGKGTWFGAGSWQHGRVQNLAPGIWAKRGIHGVDVQPVLLFVRVPTYRQRIDLVQLGQQVVDRDAQRLFGLNLAVAMAGASA